MNSEELAALRQEYCRGVLRREDLSPDPVAQFRLWFEQARKAELLEPNAMTLATVDAGGQPNVRTVLLKAYDERGFVFYTNYESTKAREMAENARVALLFPWLALERQVKITGQAVKVSTAETLKYFVSRPFGSRLGAWVSQQSKVISSRSLLEAKLAELKQKFQGGEVPLPGFWGGYRVEPTGYEFWQGGQHRLHDRFAYAPTPQGQGWEISRLSP